MRSKIDSVFLGAVLLLVTSADAQGQSASTGGGAVFFSAIGPLIGALIAFLGLQAQARFQARREDERWERARREDREKWERERTANKEREARTAAAELAKRIAMAANSMTWMLWIARHDSTRFVSQHVVDHDNYMKGLYSELVSAQVSLAAVDHELYAESLPLMQALYDLDAQIALRAICLPSSVEELGAIWILAKKFEESVPDVFSRVLSRAGQMVVAVQGAKSRPAPNSPAQPDGYAAG